MKKVLICGGSHSELPIIEAVKLMGCFVITTGLDKNSVGHKIADKYIAGDFSDKEFIYKLAKSENVNNIISGANDFSYLSVSYACEKLGLSGHDTFQKARLVHIKSEFRSALNKINIRSPKIFRVNKDDSINNLLNRIKFPIVVKPIDLTGGKGVSICETPDQLYLCLIQAFNVTRENYVIIEEYIYGTNHGFSSFIKNGKVVWHIIDNEQYGMNKYLVKGAFVPSSVPKSAEWTLINDIEKFAKTYNLVDGLFHVQFILSEDGYPIMIDPCRRMPGDLYVLLSKYATSIDVPLEIAKFEMGLNNTNEYNIEHNFIARECIMSNKNGIIKSIFIDKLINDKIIYSYYNDYTNYEVIDCLKYKAGILLLKFDSYDEMIDIVSRFDDLVKLEIV